MTNCQSSTPQANINTNVPVKSCICMDKGKSPQTQTHTNTIYRVCIRHDRTRGLIEVGIALPQASGLLGLEVEKIQEGAVALRAGASAL